MDNIRDNEGHSREESVSNADHSRKDSASNAGHSREEDIPNAGRSREENTQETGHRSNIQANLRLRKNFQYKIIWEGMIIGAVVGGIISLFRWMLSFADWARTVAVGYARSSYTGVFIIAGVLILFAIIINLLLKFEPNISGSGIPHVEAELKGLMDMNWWKVLIAKVIGCTLAIGGGFALGREGPSIQIGAMVGKGFSRMRKCLLTEERILITAGAGAGLAAAFGAPLAGCLFVLEELHRNFSGEVLFSTMAAACVADFVSAYVFGLSPVFNINVNTAFPLKYYGLLVVLGVVLGFFGKFFNWMIGFMAKCFGKMGSRIGKLAIGFVLTFILMFLYPEVLGSGSSIVERVANGSYTLVALIILLVMKFLFFNVCSATGSPGGIFLPLLVIGGVTGGLLARASEALFGIPGEYIDTFVVVAMAGYFASIVHAPVTGIILITEMTGTFVALLPIVLVSLTSFLIADYFGGSSVYHQMLERLINKKTPLRKNRNTIIDAEIHVGSYMDGREIVEFGLPRGALVVSVCRGDEEIIPSGRTVLRGGDEIEILLKQNQIEDADILIRELANHVDPQ